MKIGPCKESQAPLGQPGNTQAACDDRKNPTGSPSSVDQTRNREDIVQLSGAGVALNPEPYSRIGYDSDKLLDQHTDTVAKTGNRLDVPEGDSTTRQNDFRKLERVRHRIKSGFYDQPDVLEKIAHRLAEELTDVGEEQGDSYHDHGYGDDRQ